MARKINYAELFTLRKDGRYQGKWRDASGVRHTTCCRDPEELYHRIREKEEQSAQKTVTVADAAEKWREIRFERLSYKTVEAYKPVFRRLTARFGADGLEDVDTRSVSAWLQTLAAQGYAKRTVQMHRDMLSQIYNYAIGEGLTKINPVDHAATPRGLSAGTRGMASEEAIEAVKNGLGHPFGLYAYVCLYAGLRRGEALALRHEDVDRDAGVIHITRAVEYRGNDPRIKEPKTKSGSRDVILLDVLAAAIPKGKGLLFPGSDGQLLTKEAYNARWSAYCKAIGHTLTAHQLRHGYATLLYEAGVRDKDAQEQLGHANITLTRDVYTHISSRQRTRTAARLNRYVEESAAPAEETDEIVAQILRLMEGRDAGAILARLAAVLAEETGE